MSSDRLTEESRLVAPAPDTMESTMITDAALEQANAVLTPVQLEIWRLVDSGRSIRQVALIRGTTREAVRDALHRAWIKLDAAGIKCGENGQWFITKEGSSA